jgi:toxin ParE1/3/4
MSRYVLMPAAKEDLAAIRAYYLHQAGYRVARRMIVEFSEVFSFLARTPGAGHHRQDLAEARPILFWPMRDYLILYRPATNPLEILTILHASRDLPQLIERREL